MSIIFDFLFFLKMIKFIFILVVQSVVVLVVLVVVVDDVFVMIQFWQWGGGSYIFSDWYEGNIQYLC